MRRTWYASEELKGDKEVVQEEVKQTGKDFGMLPRS